jgi:hypothetical protein
MASATLACHFAARVADGVHRLASSLLLAHEHLPALIALS